VGEKKHISDDPRIVVNFANRLSNWSQFRHIGDDMEEGSQAQVKGLKAVRLAPVLAAFRLQVQLSVRCGLSYVRWRNLYPTTLGSIVLISALAR